MYMFSVSLLSANGQVLSMSTTWRSCYHQSWDTFLMAASCTLSGEGVACTNDTLIACTAGIKDIIKRKLAHLLAEIIQKEKWETVNIIYGSETGRENTKHYS